MCLSPTPASRRYESTWDGLHYFLPFIGDYGAQTEDLRCEGGVAHMIMQVLVQAIFNAIPPEGQGTDANTS